MRKIFINTIFCILLVTGANIYTFQNARAESDCASVKLNEILPNPAGADTGNEWIELYNCEGQNISLDQYELIDKSAKKHSLSGQTVPANGYLVIYPDFSLNQSDEKIKLIKQAETIDAFEYSTSHEAVSWARDRDGIGKWIEQEIPTPGEANQGETNHININNSIRINEIFPSPDTKNDETEWLELYNFSDEIISLDGWELKDKSSSQNLNDLTINPNAYLIIQNSELKISLNNSGDEITLYDSQETQVSKFTYIETETSISNIFWENTIKQTKTPTPNEQNTFTPIQETEDSEETIESPAIPINITSSENSVIPVRVTLPDLKIPQHQTAKQDEKAPSDMAVRKTAQNPDYTGKILQAGGFTSSIATIIMMFIKKE